MMNTPCIGGGNMIIGSFIISFFCLYLMIATLSSLNKARMYPPKKVLKQRIGLYGGLAFLFLIVALISIRFQ
jgi:uncharacterized membrane protein